MASFFQTRVLRRLRAFLVGGASALLLNSSCAPVASAAPALRVGVYYFPGWNSADNHDWSPIKRFPDREPLLGWYKGSDPVVIKQQLRWMVDAGISYVAFDWYWRDGAVGSDDAMKTYLALPDKRIDFAVMWANDHVGIGPAEWRNIVAFWIGNYFKNPRYLRLGGRPVVFVLNQQTFVANAAKAQSTPDAYLAAAQTIAHAAGLPDIAFVAGFDDLSYGFVTHDAAEQGFAAVSAYNLQRSPLTPWKPGWEKVPHPLTHGYPALDADAYRQNWAVSRRANLPVVLPMTTGWDARPWGGSGDPLHDQSIATPAQFRAHLEAAKRIMLQSGKAHSGLGVICCWNEYGEGSFLEPTKARKTALLDQVKAVFGR